MEKENTTIQGDWYASAGLYWINMLQTAINVQNAVKVLAAAGNKKEIYLCKEVLSFSSNPPATVNSPFNAGWGS